MALGDEYMASCGSDFVLLYYVNDRVRNDSHKYGQPTILPMSLLRSVPKLLPTQPSNIIPRAQSVPPEFHFLSAILPHHLLIQTPIAISALPSPQPHSPAPRNHLESRTSSPKHQKPSFPCVHAHDTHDMITFQGLHRALSPFPEVSAE
ncbi:hypothetical protein CC80DRAFT_200359 [Byssothecium circinans]|uniref:Uncharacterized protein n=1 Tax=Byssothecium circinans TaxID=147558 RepID=A0A6A5UDX7_9PLEO|nr:hypothetical protein CC80DRAFT_200359 [Byssothecium circinans]